MTTITWWGACSVMWSSTSWNRPTGSSTTGITTDAVVSWSPTQGVYRRDSRSLMAQRTQVSATRMLKT